MLQYNSSKTHSTYKLLTSVKNFVRHCNCRIWIVLAVFIALTGTFKVANGQDNTGFLSIEVIKPNLDENTAQIWLHDLLESNEEMLPIRNPKLLIEKLQQAGLGQNTIDELAQAFKTHLSFKEMSKILQFYSPFHVSTYLYLSSSLKQKLSYEALLIIYTHLIKTNMPPPNLIFESKRQIEKYFERGGLNPATTAELMKQVYHIADSYYFFITPDNWRLLTLSMRLDEIKQITTHSSRESLNVELIISKNDDLKAIAQKFAGGRDPLEIEAILSEALSHAKSREVAIPLQNILHPFIEQHVHKYSPYAGENCFRCGIMSNRKNWLTDNELINRQQLMDIAYKNYRFIAPNEPLQNGDLLIYFDLHGVAKHVSTYIIDGIIFTKNGTAKFSPYTFQAKNENEEIYFKDRKFRLSVFRPINDSQSAISELGYDAYSGRKIYYEDYVPQKQNFQCSKIYNLH